MAFDFLAVHIFETLQCPLHRLLSTELETFIFSDLEIRNEYFLDRGYAEGIVVKTNEIAQLILDILKKIDFTLRHLNIIEEQLSGVRDRNTKNFKPQDSENTFILLLIIKHIGVS